MAFSSWNNDMKMHEGGNFSEYEVVKMHHFIQSPEDHTGKAMGDSKVTGEGESERKKNYPKLCH